MKTRETIIELAEQLIRTKGYNAFSFYDISKEIGIKTASIHYHFPAKRDLCAEAIRNQAEQLTRRKNDLAEQAPVEQLMGFLDIYTKLKSENRICMVGSLATDLNTLDAEIKHELKNLAWLVLDWVTGILEQGKKQGIFAFQGSARTRALMIITNMMAMVQLTRLADTDDFETIKKTILNDLKQTI